MHPMKARLSVTRDDIPESAMACARDLYDADSATDEFDEKRSQILGKYGMGVWFSAIEAVCRERATPY